MNKPVFTCISVFLLLLLTSGPAYSLKKKSRITTIHYSSMELLREFNGEIYLPRSLRRTVAIRGAKLVDDEVIAKVNAIIEKAQRVLDMFPDKFHVHIVLLPTKRDVVNLFYKKYGKKFRSIAYYSLSEKTIYISVNDSNLRVLTHEIGHAIVDHYFKVRPPYNIHELMAQFVEKNISK